MEVSLDPKLEQFAEAQVSSGAYSTFSDVVNEALALLQERQAHDFVDDLSDQELAVVRSKIQEGINSLDRGERCEWNAEDIKAEGRRLLAEKRQAAP